MKNIYKCIHRIKIGFNFVINIHLQSKGLMSNWMPTLSSDRSQNIYKHFPFFCSYEKYNDSNSRNTSSTMTSEWKEEATKSSSWFLGREWHLIPCEKVNIYKYRKRHDWWRKKRPSSFADIKRPKFMPIEQSVTIVIDSLCPFPSRDANKTFGCERRIYSCSE